MLAGKRYLNGFGRRGTETIIEGGGGGGGEVASNRKLNQKNGFRSEVKKVLRTCVYQTVADATVRRC